MSTVTTITGEDDGYAPPFMRNYAVFVLLLAYVASFIDRQILGLLVEPIKADLGLTDLSFSLLHGFAFAIFYTAVGLILGWVADHWSRRNLIIIGVVIWSFATAFCGFANTFLVLFLARVFVGVGEASLSPAAYSMISDYFPPQKRASAMSLYTLGVYVGSGIAFVLGGVVIGLTQADASYTILRGVTLKPWQLAFVLAALPGIIIVLLLATLREPQRRERAKIEAEQSLAAFLGERSGIYGFMIFG
ncbi:MAG TPA: MFS transporter, partial [Sphingomonadales bacterium]